MQQPATYNQAYDQSGYGGAGGPPDIGVKGRTIALISAVRTLLRSAQLYSFFTLYFTDMKCLIVPLIAVNLVIIGYELILGG